MLEVAGGIIIAALVIGLFALGLFMYILGNEENFLGAEKAKIVGIIMTVFSLALMAYIVFPQF